MLYELLLFFYLLNFINFTVTFIISDHKHVLDTEVRLTFITFQLVLLPPSGDWLSLAVTVVLTNFVLFISIH